MVDINSKRGLPDGVHDAGKSERVLLNEEITKIANRAFALTRGLEEADRSEYIPSIETNVRNILIRFLKNDNLGTLYELVPGYVKMRRG